MKKTFTQVIRLCLISENDFGLRDKKGAKDEKANYKQTCALLWSLQREVRELKNHIISEMWEWQGFSNEYSKTHYELNGDKKKKIPPKCEEHLKVIDPKTGEVKEYTTVSGYIYQKYMPSLLLNSGNVSTTLNKTVKKYNSDRSKILKGEISLTQFKGDQPIDIHNKNIRYDYDSKHREFRLGLSLLNTKGKAKYGISQMIFRVLVKDNSQRTVLERLYDDIYKTGASQLIYDRRKGMWFLNLTYTLDKEVAEPDKDRILGVNVGIKYPVCCSVYGEKHRLLIPGQVLQEERQRLYEIRRSKQMQIPVSSDNRRGHGRYNLIEPVYKDKQRESNFAKTFNDQVSRKVVDYAKAHECGTIQIEKLEGVTKESDERFLKSWSYYDLQQKIILKAESEGIDVVYVDPKYTTRRCSKCGAIYKDNVNLSTRTFLCKECGFKTFQDFNASQNIAISGIDEIINEYVKSPENKKRIKEEYSKSKKKGKEKSEDTTES